MGFDHIPVLLDETITGLNINPDGIYVDCTVGGGGHSEEILKRLNHGSLIAIDQDTEALEVARVHLRPWADQVIFVHANFKDLKDILKNLSIEKVDGIILDIGVSSHQLDDGERGFSYHEDALLDMRMDQENSNLLTAKEIVNTYSEEELSQIFWDYGEERWGKRIADFIVRAREEREINTTLELVEIIKRAIPKKVRMQDKHPARKVFQALRIEVNQELEVLKKVLMDGVDVLNTRGRFCVITFHSLEDRIVKQTFKTQSLDCICPPDFPVCVCDKESEVKIINKKPITAKEDELDRNPRSRSAKLRIVEKI